MYLKKAPMCDPDHSGLMSPASWWGGNDGRWSKTMVKTTMVKTWSSDMNMLITALEHRKRSEDCRAQAAECRKIAGRWPGLVKRQYEELARQWLMVAKLAETSSISACAA
jgi:hypothetical protein